MIKAIDLTRVYVTGTKRVVALDHVSFDIKSGAFVTITGRSGSGKSTLLYQLGLLDHPTEGKVLIDDKDVTTLKNGQRTDYRLRNLGYVFQDYALIPTMDAIENVYVPLLMVGYSNNEANDIAAAALDSVGLFDKRYNLPSQLSGGEQQRVSIARAIADKPKIIFADEPTANLDSETADKVLNVLIDLNKKGQTIVMVTHEKEYAKLGSKILCLTDGKLT